MNKNLKIKIEYITWYSGNINPFSRIIEIFKRCKDLRIIYLELNGHYKIM